MQRIVICGHLGRDPELKVLSGGKSVVEFSVAVSEKSSSEEHTEWFNVQAWEKQAEACNKYLTKGSQVVVDGRLKTDSYTGKDGSSKKFTRLIASHVEFVGKRDSTTNVKTLENTRSDAF